MSTEKPTGKLTPSRLGVLKVKMLNGDVKEFHMNRADRRKFIKAHQLKKG